MQVSADEGVVCALVSPDVYCWGTNHHGAAGNFSPGVDQVNSPR